ncbi:hypothetical protein [Streptomyces sp. CoT10]|uniref:hypothetical protein n=1 Tax=Streptomyces sp. CoT10 TaxID=2875762 RepID=UPI001CD7D8AB|nr:hypothetical protein [Streptomyces sp. CoT10]
MPYPTPRPPAATSGPGQCPQCWQRVLWTITASGNRQPVDPTPDPAGRVAVDDDGTGRYRSRQLSTDRPVTEHAEVLHIAHHATCTNPQRRPRTSRTQPRHGARPTRWQR